MSGTSAGVDASIPLQAGKGVPQPNPLQQISEFAAAKNALNNLALFPGQQQLQQGNIALQGQQVQGGKVDLQGKINQSVYGSLAPLLAGAPITHDSLTTALASAEKNLGLPTHGVLGHLLESGPPTGDTPDFDKRVRALILAGAQPAASAAGAVTPTQGTVDTGPAIQPVTIGARGMPDSGVVTPAGGSFVKGLDPATATTPTQIGTTPDGRPVYGTRGQFIGAAGASASSSLGDGRFPAALRNPANAPAPSESGPQPGGGIAMGLGPAGEAAARTTGDTSAKAFQDIADQGVQAQSQKSILGTMLADAQQFTPGPTAINNLRAWLTRYGAAVGTSFGLPAEKVAANESFDKLAAQIANAQGAGSDARLSVIQHANPGSQLSPQGVDGIIRQLQGNADYLQARSQMAAQYPNKADRAGFEANIGKNLDPRAFQFARMTPQQKVDFAKNLTDTDRKALESSYNWAARNGLIGGGGG